MDGLNRVLDGRSPTNLVDCNLVLLQPISDLQPDPSSEQPIYRQLAKALTERIENGRMQAGERLPATRELAGQLGLNRTTISAAYTLLEEAGLISGHVGRGSFVLKRTGTYDDRSSSQDGSTINFASSRPAADDFPLASFRRLAKAVIDGPEAAEILQLGSPQGYAPLRRYLLDAGRECGIADATDEVIVTNGCQQALDLIARVYVSQPAGAEPATVLVEDPVYHGLLKIFRRAGARLVPVPVTSGGLDVTAAEELMARHRPKLLVVTPEFQNPTGLTLSLADRKRLLDAAHKNGVIIVENGIYSELRYRGEAIPSLKELDEAGQTILLRSYSKVSFPGLRVGWATGPRGLIRRLAEEKQVADLHSDQLAQAIFLRFAQSGELANHIARTCVAGERRLDAAFRSCQQSWPTGTSWTCPEGGMCLWVELPAPLTSESLLNRAQREGVEFLPGPNFSVHGAHQRGLRISFGGLAPETIERGISILGRVAHIEMGRREESYLMEPAAALV